MPASTTLHPPEPKLPIPIYQPSESIPRYLLYDISHISYLRSHHAILGVLIGTLPQIPQQSVFLGLPLELQPEEAQLLVDKGIAYIVNDREWHEKDFRQECGREKEAIIEKLRIEGLEMAKEFKMMKQERTRLILQEQARGREKGKGNASKKGRQDSSTTTAESLEKTKPEAQSENDNHPFTEATKEGKESEEEEEPTLFDYPTQPQPQSQPPPSPPGSTSQATPTPHSRSRSTSAHDPNPWAITPTTSISKPPPPPLDRASAPSPPLLSPFPHSGNTTTPHPALSLKTTYPLFTHLHSLGYYLTPGLRFGCHFSVYPGDPLRFHSHFLASAYAWEEERELVEIVGGGRLGTGVKKGWLAGGVVSGDCGEEGEGNKDEEGEGEREEGKGNGKGNSGEVRCFCVEWGGM